MDDQPPHKKIAALADARKGLIAPSRMHCRNDVQPRGEVARLAVLPPNTCGFDDRSRAKHADTRIPPGCKHGCAKRLVWRKDHIGINRTSMEIRAAEIASSDVGTRACCPLRSMRSRPNQGPPVVMPIKDIIGDVLLAVLCACQCNTRMILAYLRV